MIVAESDGQVVGWGSLNVFNARSAYRHVADFSVYVDAKTSDIRRWYTDRFLRLRETAFRDPASYFARYASLSQEEATAEAGRLWDTINGPNPDKSFPAGSHVNGQFIQGHPRPGDPPKGPPVTFAPPVAHPQPVQFHRARPMRASWP